MAASPLTPDDVLHQCLVAYGSGTRGVPTQRSALDVLIKFFLTRFATAVGKDPLRFTDKDDAHILERLFVLRCAEALGRRASQKAISRGAVSISAADIDAARIDVINANSPNPGDWCN